MANNPSTRILVVDDAEPVRAGLRTLLELHDYEVLEAGNGLEGLKVFQEEKPHLVLLDLKMPGIDGIEVLEDITRRAPDTPVIIVSGTHLIDDAVNALRIGAWDYILKPIRDLPVLLHAVEKALERARLIAENRAYQENLEEKIQKRTAELQATNASLRREIAERRGVEEALRKSEEKYRLLAETTAEIILTLDLKGRITYMNKAGQGISGYKEEEALGKSILDLLAADGREEFKARMARQISGKEEARYFETELIRKNGKTTPVELTSASLAEHGEPSGLLITGRDVTEKIRAEEQAKLHQEQLFHAAKMASLGTLVSGVAHEINNPITFVTLNAPILQRIFNGILPILEEHHRVNGDFQVNNMSYAQIRERVPLFLSDISDGARRVKDIVSELKDFARQSPLEMKDMVDVNQVVDKAVRLVSNLIKKSTKRFTVNHGVDIPGFRGAAARIEQVVVNTLVNACQALQNNRQSITVTTMHNDRSGEIIIRVEDQGAGMPPEVLDRIKDPFFTTKRNSGGTGLGLAISDRIVKDHGGAMTFVSAPGRGATVKIRLPAPSGRGREQER
ncbi:MAG: PAS domain S-box protein [Desulfobacterales bacterium]|nr:PAS domain S-box protein [Desulfobacterales bacterium]